MASKRRCVLRRDLVVRVGLLADAIAISRSSASIRSRPFCQWSIAATPSASATALVEELPCLHGRRMLPGRARYTRPMPRAATAEPPAEEHHGAKPQEAASPRSRASDGRGAAHRRPARRARPGERRAQVAGGLLIPATAMPAPKRLSWADVTLVGPDVRVAKPGDRVLFLPSAGLEVELEGEELVLLRERDVQAVSRRPPTDAKDRAPGQYL